MLRRTNRATVLSFSAFFAVLAALVLAGASAAIFYPCDDTCYPGTSPTARCSYWQGDGSCPAYPNPCYMTCEKYWSCTSGPSFATEPTAEARVPEIDFGADANDWLEAMSHNYGPCLELIVDNDAEQPETVVPASLEVEPVDEPAPVAEER